MLGVALHAGQVAGGLCVGHEARVPQQFVGLLANAGDVALLGGQAGAVCQQLGEELRGLAGQHAFEHRLAAGRGRLAAGWLLA